MVMAPVVEQLPKEMKALVVEGKNQQVKSFSIRLPSTTPSNEISEWPLTPEILSSA